MANSTRRISSRLLKKEKTKVLRQTWFFVFFAVVLVALFIFVILPNFIAITTSLLGSNNTPFAPKDTLPPYTPTFTAPPKATTEEQLTLFGYAEPESEVIVVLNGEGLEPITAQADGAFEASLQLTEGENIISTFARDSAGNESQLSRQYTIELDTQIPTLEITSPENGSKILGRTNRTITVSGVSDPGVKISINGRLAYAKQDGTFSQARELSEGDNELVVSATDDAGNTIEQKLSVRFEL